MNKRLGVILLSTALVACVASGEEEGGVPDHTPARGDGGAGGEGGTGGTTPWTEGSAGLQRLWHQALRCDGSSTQFSLPSLERTSSGLVIGGWLRGSCDRFDGEPTSTDGHDPMVAVLGQEDGAAAWTQRPHAAGDQRFDGIAAAGGALSLVGSFDAPFELDGELLEPLPTTGTPSRTLLLARSDAEGSVQWTKRFATNAIFTNAVVAGSAEGDLVMGLEAWDDIDFGGGTLPGDIFDSFLVRYDATGAHQFSLVLESAQSFAGVTIDDIAVDDAGHSWLLGRFSADLNIGGEWLLPSGEAMYLVAVDATGTSVHSRILSGGDCPLELRAVPSGMLLGGRCAAPLDLGDGALSATEHSVVARYQLDGTLAWTLDLGEAVHAVSFDADSNGGAIVGGAFVGELVLEQEQLLSAGGSDAFVALVSPTGTVESSQRFGGPYDDRIEDLRVLDDSIVTMGYGLVPEEEIDPSLPRALVEVVALSR